MLGHIIRGSLNEMEFAMILCLSGATGNEVEFARNDTHNIQARDDLLSVIDASSTLFSYEFVANMRTKRLMFAIVLALNFFSAYFICRGFSRIRTMHDNTKRAVKTYI